MVDDVVAGNRRTHGYYADALCGVPGVRLFSHDPDEQTNYQYVVVLVEAGGEARDAAMKALHAHGVLARRYFWPGVRRMEPYASAGPPRGSLSATPSVADRVLVLPGGAGRHREVTVDIARVIEEALDGR